MNYQVIRLKDPDSPGPLKLLEQLKQKVIPALAQQGISTFGVFQGLFGIASNELYLVVNSESDTAPINQQLSGLKILATTDLVPTVRPLAHSPREKEGIYVFRWFKVFNKDVDEIASLSKQAWETFESGFDTEVQGLFAESDRTNEQGEMLLITWYADLNAWQDSRAPAPEARENFMKRHQLTIEATPVATRLVSTDATPIVPGGENKFS